MDDWARGTYREKCDPLKQPPDTPTLAGTVVLAALGPRPHARSVGRCMWLSMAVHLGGVEQQVTFSWRPGAGLQPQHDVPCRTYGRQLSELRGRVDVSVITQLRQEGQSGSRDQDAREMTRLFSQGPCNTGSSDFIR